MKKIYTPEELAKNWVIIREIHSDTYEQGPREAMERIIKRMGKNAACQTFACVCAIKEHDGRIYGENRTFMGTIEFDRSAAVWSAESGNPMRYCGLDDIHPTHINQMITELRARCVKS